MTVDWSSDDRYRYTLTLTPMTEDDIQAVLDDIRARFGRAPLVHVIDKRDRHSHLDDVCSQAEGAGETAVLRQQLDEAHRKIAALHAVAYPDQSGRENGALLGAGDEAASGGEGT